MLQESAQDKIKQFWNTKQGVHNTSVGGLGGGKELESDYRTYFELEHLKKLVPFDRTKSLLEFGSGNGRWALGLAPLLGQYEGVEFSDVSVKIAKLAVEERGIDNAQFHHCKATDFLSAKQYDIIYFAGITQYLEDNEIKTILNHLSSCCRPTTIIVDRSTVRYNKREIRDNKTSCYTIYRTPEEIIEIYAASGFHIYYQGRSYRFLRGFKLLNRFILRGPLVPLRRILAAFIRVTKPFSVYPMLWFSVVADSVWPAPWNKGDGSHDFFLFKRDGSFPEDG